MYKLQIAFANIFFKIKSSFLSFLQAPGAWVKQIVLMETRGGGQHPTHTLCRGSGHTLLTPSHRENAQGKGCSCEVHRFPTPGSCGTICSQSLDPLRSGSATLRLWERRNPSVKFSFLLTPTLFFHLNLGWFPLKILKIELSHLKKMIKKKRPPPRGLALGGGGRWGGAVPQSLPLQNGDSQMSPLLDYWRKLNQNEPEEMLSTW